MNSMHSTPALRRSAAAFGLPAFVSVCAQPPLAQDALRVVWEI